MDWYWLPHCKKYNYDKKKYNWTGRAAAKFKILLCKQVNKLKITKFCLFFAVLLQRDFYC